MAREIRITVVGDEKGVGTSVGKAEAAINKLTPSGDKAHASVKKLGDELASHLGPAGGTASKVFDKLGGAVGGLGPTALVAGAGVAAVGTALIKFGLDGVQAFASATAEVRSFQRVTGASAEDASKFVAVFKVLGVDSDVASKGIVKLAADIEHGTSKLGDYGIQVAKNHDGTTNLTATLENVAGAFNKETDAAKKDAMAKDLFGKAGIALLPILTKNKDALDELFKAAQQHHEIFSQSDLDKGRQFNLATKELHAALTGLEIQVGSKLVPVLTGLAHATTKVAEGTDEVTSRYDKFNHNMDSLSNKMFSAVGIHLSYFDASKKVAKGHEDLAQTAYKSAAAMQDEAKAAAADDKAHQDLVKSIDAVLSGQAATIDSSLGAEHAHRTLEKATKDEQQAWAELGAAIRAHGPKSAEAAAAADKLKDAQMGTKDASVGLAEATVRLAADQAAAAGAPLDVATKNDHLRDTLNQLAGTLDPKNPLRSQLAGFAAQLQGIPAAKEVVLTLDDSQFNAEMVKVGSQLRQIHGDVIVVHGSMTTRAGGGPLDAGQLSLVGENGPELFVPKVSGTILPYVPRVTSGRPLTTTAPPAPSGSAAPIVINVNAPNYVGDKQDLVRALQDPQVAQAVVNAVRQRAIAHA